MDGRFWKGSLGNPNSAYIRTNDSIWNSSHRRLENPLGTSVVEGQEEEVGKRVNMSVDWALREPS